MNEKDVVLRLTLRKTSQDKMGLILAYLEAFVDRLIQEKELPLAGYLLDNLVIGFDKDGNSFFKLCHNEKHQIYRQQLLAIIDGALAADENKEELGACFMKSILLKSSGDQP